MLVDIDNRNQNDFIIEDLDEEHLLVKDTKVAALKARLQQVYVTNMHCHNS
jgi:TFIIH basal transcription factor complex TTD-A subunit